LQNAAIYVLSFVFVLGVLIFVHEFGHFLVAKFFKVRVLTFSLGFGKRLWGFKKGDTDYRLSVLPVGGYVRMAGEYPTDDTVGSPDEFLSKPRWQRLLVGLAGATMNILMAVLVLAAVLKVSNREPVYLSQSIVVGSLTDNSAAGAAGIAVGDRIIQLNDKTDPTWQDVENLSFTGLTGPVHVVVDRGGKTLRLDITPNKISLPDTGEKVGDLGIQPAIPVQVRNLAPGFPAAISGIQEGDLILRIGDHPISKAEDFIYLNDTIHKSVGKPLVFEFKRGDVRFTKEISPILDPALGFGRIGFRPDIPTANIRLSVAGALQKSAKENTRFSILTFKVLGQLVTGKTSPKTLVGPIGIFKVTGEAAKTSASDLFRWMAFISLQLGIFNLLPIPVLDGGMVFMLLVESAIRRDLSRVAKERLIQVGFIFLMLLMGYVIYNDTLRLTPWGKPHSNQTAPAETPSK
jgi:regulator of sigma E protease